MNADEDSYFGPGAHWNNAGWDGKPPRYRWHLGCTLASGLHSSQDASDIVADRAEGEEPTVPRWDEGKVALLPPPCASPHPPPGLCRVAARRRSQRSRLLVAVCARWDRWLTLGLSLLAGSRSCFATATPASGGPRCPTNPRTSTARPPASAPGSGPSPRPPAQKIIVPIGFLQQLPKRLNWVIISVPS